jgi:Right handed beta helix region/Protein of unknown function (DUF1565)
MRYLPSLPLSLPRSGSRFARRRVSFFAATAVMLVGNVGLASLPVSAASTDIVYVDPAGDDTASGTASNPVRTIGRAVQIAPSGATVSIAGGTYHEQVQVYSKEIHLVAAPGEEVVLDGATTISSWTRTGPDRWSAAWSTIFDRATAPFTTPENPVAGWPEQLFLDGGALTQVTSVDDVGPGSFFHDRVVGRVVIGDDPSGRLVEGSDLNWGLYLNGADGSSVTDLVVQRYATRTKDMAAVRAYADDVKLDGVTVVDNARIGVSVIGEHARLSEVVALRNGHLGIHAHRCADLVISRAVVRENNAAGFDAHHSAGGIKITESAAVVVETSTVSENGGPGIWTDLSVTDAVVKSNVVTDNARSGIEIELSTRIMVMDNTVRHNGEAGVWVLESAAVDVWHNAVYDNVRDVWVEDGPRSDVHDVTVFNNLLGGDIRHDAAGAILNVDDWTEERSAVDMGVRAGSNRYWLLPNRTTAISRWSRWPDPLAVSSSIDEHRAATGQDVGSDVVIAPNDPFGRTIDDVRQSASSPLGVELPPGVAAALGVSVGHRAPAGPLIDRTTKVLPPTSDDPASNEQPPPPPRSDPPVTVDSPEPPSLGLSSGGIVLPASSASLRTARRISSTDR